MSEAPLRFVRLGPQRHLLVLSASASPAVKKVRHQLQQVAANRSWFLYHASAVNPSPLLRGRALAQFDVVVLNQLPRNQMSASQNDALNRFEHGGGRVVAIVGDLTEGSLE